MNVHPHQQVFSTGGWWWFEERAPGIYVRMYREDPGYFDRERSEMVTEPHYAHPSDERPEVCVKCGRGVMGHGLSYAPIPPAWKRLVGREAGWLEEKRRIMDQQLEDERPIEMEMDPPYDPPERFEENAFVPREVRVVDPVTGGAKGAKPEVFDNIPVHGLEEVARVYGYGAKKYDRANFLKGYAWSLSVCALFRHIFAFCRGESRDGESGLHHLAHAAFHLFALMEFERRGIGTDDRLFKDHA